MQHSTEIVSVFVYELLKAAVPALKTLFLKYGKKSKAKLESGETIQGEIMDVGERYGRRYLIVKTKERKNIVVPLRNLEEMQIYNVDAESFRRDKERLKRTTNSETIKAFLQENPEAEIMMLELLDRGILRVDELRGALGTSGYNVDIRRTNTVLKNLIAIGAISRINLKYELTKEGKGVLS